MVRLASPAQGEAETSCRIRRDRSGPAIDFGQYASGATGLNEEAERGSALYKFLEQTAADYMTREPKTVSRDMTMAKLCERFEKEDFNTYPVADGTQVVGMVSKFDLLSCFVFTPARILPRYEDLMQRPTADVMTTEFVYVVPETRLTRVLELMISHRLRSIPVLEGERLAGIISREDVMRALRDCAG
jgi:CBS domain-containing protein